MIQVPHSRKSLEPRAPAQSCHTNDAVHRLHVPRQGWSISSSRWQVAQTIVACLALHLAIYPSRTLLLTRTRQQEPKNLAQYWIPEDALAETSTRVCVERSVLVLTAAECREEMEKLLPTMMLPSEQNPSEHEEQFLFQDPAHPCRRAVVKQELADVRRSHKLDVKRNAYESQGEQTYKTSARSSVEKLSIKSIFNVHTVPELFETKFGTR